MIAILDTPPIAATQAPTPPPPSQTSIVAELLKTVSASRLNLWASCRLKLFFRYILQLKKPPTASMHAGTVVHRVAEGYGEGVACVQVFGGGVHTELEAEHFADL